MTVQHTFQGAGAPTEAPSSVGAHYTNLANGDQYLSRGTASVADWVRVPKPGEGGGLSVGDVLYTLREPGTDFLPTDGGPFDGEEYPLLADLLPGKAWQQLGGGLPGWETPRLPGTDNAGTWLWAFVSGLYRSNDDGITWTQIFTAWDTYRDAVCASGTWIVAGQSTAWRSTDGGETWSEEYIGSLRTTALATDGAGNWVAVTTGGVYYNHADGVGDWEYADGGGSANTWARLTFGNGTWVSVIEGAIRLSTDGGETWSLVQNDVGYSRALATDSNGVWVYGAADSLWRSSDNGATWASGSLPFDGVSITGLTYLDGEFIVSLTSYGNPKAARSTDGQAWVEDAAFPGDAGGFSASTTGTVLGAWQVSAPIRYAGGEEHFALPSHDAPAPFSAYIKAR